MIAASSAMSNMQAGLLGALGLSTAAFVAQDYNLPAIVTLVLRH